jgi:hypothetical protein
MKQYERTENGITTTIPLAEGLSVINYAMMDGKRFVQTMSAARGDARIEYKNGIKITLRQVEVEVDDSEEPQEWSITRAGSNIVHRFHPETLVGRCNKSYRPHYYGDGYSLEARSAVREDLHRVCPKCEAK